MRRICCSIVVRVRVVGVVAYLVGFVGLLSMLCIETVGGERDEPELIEERIFTMSQFGKDRISALGQGFWLRV